MNEIKSIKVCKTRLESIVFSLESYKQLAINLVLVPPSMRVRVRCSEVPGGGWCLNPISVPSLSLSQAEQFLKPYLRYFILDLGFSSGITDQNSSGSEPLDPADWRVRVSDLSDHGYASYLTDQMDKKYR